ncbi:MAG: hypothetical protein IT458_03670 [Planctomycetes bacterium]|nr:hypothetical protein [Planctomycetota bacterium]
MTSTGQDQVRIEPFGPRHWPGLMRLYLRWFGAHAAGRFAARWQWQFASNPYVALRRPVIAVAVLGDEVVGHHAAFPLPLRVDGSVRTFLCSCDMVAEPRHRITAIPLAQRIASQGDVLASGGSPQARRIGSLLGLRPVTLTRQHLILTRRQGGAVRRMLRRRLPGFLRSFAGPRAAAFLAPMLRPGSARRSRPLPRYAGSLQVEPLARFGAGHDALWRELSAHARFGLAKDSTYLNWRYVDAPATSLRCAQVRDRGGAARGEVVFGLRAGLDDDLEPCGQDGEIFELFLADPSDGDALRALVGHACRELDQAGVDTIATTGLLRRWHAAFEELGFHRSEEEHRETWVTVGARGPSVQAVGDPDAWLVSAGDGDQAFTWTV